MNISDQYPDFSQDCHSLVSKYLTKALFELLKDKRTNNGFSLQQAINSGVVNPDSGIGIYAGDEASYTTFAPLFDPIIEDYHGFGKDKLHISNLNPEDLNATNPDPEGHYIVSTRIRVARNLHGLPLGAAISAEHRKLVEQRVVAALEKLGGELAGRYYPLMTMSEADRARLISDHILFKAGDRFLQAAGLNRDWPESRGIFHNHDRTFSVWVNEEDHLRVISMQIGGNIKQVFTRLSEAVVEIGRELEFSRNHHLGYITSCPTNLGTAMRASVHINLPKLAADMVQLTSIADKYHLQVRGMHGEHTASEGSIFDVSNRRRLGVTEVECVQDMYDGIVALIKIEQTL